MRLSHIVFVAPLALLAACGTAPQTTGGLQSSANPENTASGDRTHGVRAVDPSTLKGLSTVQVRSVLGKPMFTRRDAPAEIWQYRGRACTLDLFLYDENGDQVVAYYAVRSPQPVNESQCMGELVSRNQGVPTS